MPAATAARSRHPRVFGVPSPDRPCPGTGLHPFASGWWSPGPSRPRSVRWAATRTPYGRCRHRGCTIGAGLASLIRPGPPLVWRTLQSRSWAAATPAIGKGMAAATTAATTVVRTPIPQPFCDDRRPLAAANYHGVNARSWSGNRACRSIIRIRAGCGGGSGGGACGMTAAVPDVLLNNGVAMPQLGFGVLQVPDDETERAVLTALEAGYRSIDTAAALRQRGRHRPAVAASGIAREELFVTTKLWNGDQGYDCDAARLRRLAWQARPRLRRPLPASTGRSRARTGYVDTWRAFEKIYADGRVQGDRRLQLPARALAAPARRDLRSSRP